MSALEVVIGLEVHCQLETHSKLFSACPLEIGAAPNTRTDPYTWGLPGTLPVLNREAVRKAIALALATHCEIHGESQFARKHYFYPDLPKGYQITQSDRPYATGGWVDVPGAAPLRSTRRCPSCVSTEQGLSRSVRACSSTIGRSRPPAAASTCRSIPAIIK